MAGMSQDLIERFQKANLASRQEGDGDELKADIREDEDQSVKLQEIIDLLVAAGYFRARIKGLSSFDKIVGGMTWCIESLNVDVDVDLLFQENSTIGQKIALTEKIVAVLPKIKCPHRIEPHQIQGLDFIHIFPVIQVSISLLIISVLFHFKWLVKVSMEARQEKAAFVKSYAISQYNKQFPSKKQQNDKDIKVKENLKVVEDVYRPHRYYKRKNAPPPDILSKVQITLLEYGFRGGQKSKVSDKKDKSDSVEENEQHNVEQLLSNLIAAKEEICQDEELTEEERQNLLKHYESLHSELKDGGYQSKETQQLLILEEQDKLLEETIAKLKHKQQNIEEEIENEQQKLQQIRLMQKKADKTLKEFAEEELNNPSLIKEIEDLVILNDHLKSQEATFKESCKKEMAKLQTEIEQFRQLKSPVELTAEQLQEVEELTEKLKLVRLELAKKNQIVAKLQRQVDDVPNRAEMTQYQRRFLELYNQVAAKHKETKQYYTLFNTLADKKTYMEKELTLMNSISENYVHAMRTPAAKEDFLKQFHNIVEGVRQNRLRLEQQLGDELRKRGQLSRILINLFDIQRSYANAVRQLTLECKNYEALLAKKS